MMDKKNMAVMLIDESVLTEMIENNNTQKAIEILTLFKKMEEDIRIKESVWIVTTQSSLLRTIYFADKDKFNLQNLQKIISCVTITPSFADFRNKEAVTKELIIYAGTLSKESAKQ